MKGRYAFVEFQTEKDAENAIREFNGVKLQGFELIV
jgi:RNA recognition motif-containing protein